MSFIAVCGGGGKTTICNKYPEKFLDIDTFIWSKDNEEYHFIISLLHYKK